MKILCANSGIKHMVNKNRDSEMSDIKCGLRYCNATVADYDYIINELKCRCMKCFGDKSNTCSWCKKLLENGIDLQQRKCMGCKFYNGR